MKKRFVILILGMMVSASAVTGCGKKNDATQASEASEETEKEGTGEDVEETGEASDEEEEEPEEEIKPEIAVFLPAAASDRRWKVDAFELRRNLTAKGYNVLLNYANDDPQAQIRQIRTVAEKEVPVEAMVIAPVDPWGLSETLAAFSDLKIPVFSYDGLIMNTDGLNYFITFDTRETGHSLARQIIGDRQLDKKKEAGESETIRIYSFEPSNTAELFLYNGFYEELQPYLEDGTLVEVRTTPDITCALETEDALNAVRQLNKRDKTAGDEEWPAIYAVSNDVSVMKDVAAGNIIGTFFYDSSLLADACANTLITYLDGDTPEISDYQQYDNGLRLVKTVTCEYEYVDQDDYQKLVDAGYFTEDELITEPPTEVLQ